MQGPVVDNLQREAFSLPSAFGCLCVLRKLITYTQKRGRYDHQAPESNFGMIRYLSSLELNAELRIVHVSSRT